MAETSPSSAPITGSPARAPALPSTADAVPYVPVSWMAVGAMAVATLFLVLLLFFGIDAVRQRRPLLMPELLVLPAIAVVLSFSARRIIRNAEGTRTGNLFGIDLPNASWWIAVVGGLGFAAYLFAIEYAVRRDAEVEVQRWIETLQKVDAAAVAGEDQNLARAFHRTRDPNERAQMNPTDTQQLEGRWRDDFVSFRQTDLVRTLLRNTGKCDFTIGGLRDWTQKPTGVECTYSVTLKCPEGTFPVRIPLKGVETGSGSGAAGGRQWQIVLEGTGYITRDTARLTPYGWFVQVLEAQGGAHGRRFIDLCSDRRIRPFAYLEFSGQTANPEFVQMSPGGYAARAAAVGATAGMYWYPSAEVYASTAARLFTQAGGAKANDNQLRTFQEAWNTVGFTQAGSRLQGNPDIHTVVVLADNSIEVRVPLEIPLSGTKGAITAARGRLVLECTTPGVVEEAKRLREAANPDQGSSIIPDDIRRRNFEWKLLRIESDLRPIQVESGPPGGGAEGMMPGH